MLETAELTVHLTLPLTQIEPLLAYLRAYPHDPADVIRSWISVDARQQMNRAEVVALLRRLGCQEIIDHPSGDEITTYRAPQEAHP